MNDLISRQAVIKAVDRHSFDTDNGLCLDNDITCILEEVPSVQTKKEKMTFSKRLKIVREYHDWRLFNNAEDCADSFLAYLCIKGYIDG